MNFNAILESMLRNEIESQLDLSTMPEDFTVLLAELESHDYYEHSTGALSYELCNELYQEDIRFNASFSDWINFKQMLQTGSMISDHMRHMAESKWGIVPRS
jgi:hypothetical protein